VRDTLVEHGVEHLFKYAVCIDDVGVQCVLNRSVERHLPYDVCVENGECGACYCNRAWCVPSPAICCVYGRWRGAVCDRVLCGTSSAICFMCGRWSGCSM